MGMTLANLAVAATADKVKELFEGEAYYLAEENGFTYIFPEDESYSGVALWAEKLSKELSTSAVCGEVYDSDSVHVAFYNNGEKVYEYDWYEQDEPEISGDIQNLFELFNFNGNKDEYMTMLPERETFAEDKYEKIVTPFGFNYELRQTGYNYIARDGIDEWNSSSNLKIEEVGGDL